MPVMAINIQPIGVVIIAVPKAIKAFAATASDAIKDPAM